VESVSYRSPTIHPTIYIGAGLQAYTSAFAEAAGAECAQERLLVDAKAMILTASNVL
jgi:hypothetical protein